jgi:uncharacterized membrane protein
MITSLTATRPLELSPSLASFFLGLAVVLPVFVSAWPALAASALLVMLSLRVEGRFSYRELIPRTSDDWMAYFVLFALSVWCVSLYFYADIQ